MNWPKWSVHTNIAANESSEYIGNSWEFFKEETEALCCFNRHKRNGNVSTKRPFHISDNKYMHIEDRRECERIELERFEQ